MASASHSAPVKKNENVLDSTTTLSAANQEADNSRETSSEDTFQSLDTEKESPWNHIDYTFRQELIWSLAKTLDESNPFPAPKRDLLTVMALDKKLAITSIKTSLPLWIPLDFDPSCQSLLLELLLKLVESAAWDFLASNCHGLLHRKKWHDPALFRVKDFVEVVQHQKPGREDAPVSDPGLRKLLLSPSAWYSTLGELLGLRNKVAHHDYSNHQDMMKYAKAAANFTDCISRVELSGVIRSLLDKIEIHMEVLRADARLFFQLYMIVREYAVSCGYTDIENIEHFFEFQWRVLVLCKKSRIVDELVRQTLNPVLREPRRVARFVWTSKHRFDTREQPW